VNDQFRALKNSAAEIARNWTNCVCEWEWARYAPVILQLIRCVTANKKTAKNPYAKIL